MRSGSVKVCQIRFLSLIRISPTPELTFKLLVEERNGLKLMILKDQSLLINTLSLIKKKGKLNSGMD